MANFPKYICNTETTKNMNQRCGEIFLPFFSSIFLSLGIKSWTTVRRLSEFIKQIVDKGFSLIPASPTIKDGLAQAFITHLISFCIINILFTPCCNSLLFFADLKGSVSSPFHPLFSCVSQILQFSSIHELHSCELGLSDTEINSETHCGIALVITQILFSLTRMLWNSSIPGWEI